MIETIQRISRNIRLGIPYETDIAIEHGLRIIWDQYVELGFAHKDDNFPKSIYEILNNSYLWSDGFYSGTVFFQGVDDNGKSCSCIIPANFISLSEGDRVQYAADRQWK